MRDFFRFERRELLVFGICALLYVAIWLAWTVLPLAGGQSIADIDSPFSGIPLIGELPQQSISKLVITAALYLVSIIYALVMVATGKHRAALPQMAILGVLTFLGWIALNYWVISGFLNSPSVLVYGAASVLLLLVWGGFLARSIATQHDATALFLVCLGLGLTLFVTIAQLIALLTPDWRTPTQGVPLLYTMTLNALVGLFLAGSGGNMLWRERRMQMLAAGSKKR
ncbi:MAG: hypothetical protein ABIV47_19485 [Roseiflexaceae bacterium]